MLIPCSRAQAVVADSGIRLDRRTPGFMVWDEHGGTFVLRVEGTRGHGSGRRRVGNGHHLEIPLSSRKG